MATGPLPPAEALAAVEEAVGFKVPGGDLYLHVPTSLVSPLGAELVTTGAMTTTVSGSVVISDRGYPGTGATGDDGVWIYGTGPIQYWLGDIVVHDQPSEYVDVSNNAIEMWAERAAMTLFNPRTLVACQIEVG